MSLEYTITISDLAIADLDIVSPSSITPTVPFPVGSGWTLFHSYASHNKIYYVWVRGSAAITVSANYIATGQEGPILVDASAGPVTITLPSLIATDRVIIKKIDASVNAVTIVPPGSELIDGLTSQLIATTYVTLHLVNNGTNWFIV
jgi:hypothetical protein